MYRPAVTSSSTDLLASSSNAFLSLPIINMKHPVILMVNIEL